jgi:protein-S-isoprenylcysteine O-methyltransferase Ste14
MDPLYRKALSRLVFFQILIGVLLFLPAGTANFWQAWVFWTVFTTAQIAITLTFLRKDPHLVENRLKAGPHQERRPAQRIVLSLALVFSLFLVILPGLDHRFGWSSVPLALIVIGELGTLAGMAVTFFVFLANTHAAATIRVEQNQRVISTGPYGMVRHPMYSGAAVLFTSIPLALGSYWALLPVPALVAALAARLLDEERFLVAHLPGYAEYCERVRYRLVPFVW